jgi:hypothetical protein
MKKLKEAMRANQPMSPRRVFAAIIKTLLSDLSLRHLTLCYSQSENSFAILNQRLLICPVFFVLFSGAFSKVLENADIPLRYPDWIPVGRPEIPQILVAG